MVRTNPYLLIPAVIAFALVSACVVGDEAATDILGQDSAELGQSDITGSQSTITGKSSDGDTESISVICPTESLVECPDSDSCDCTSTPPEVCDGVDNDRDGLVDEGNVCGCTSYTYDKRGYQLCDAQVPWAKAQAACTASGMRLTKIESAQEGGWLGSLPMGQGRWIGATDAERESVWRWFDGSAVAYAGWSQHEPNGLTRENCGQMWQGGAWNDLDCTWNAGFICEARPAETCDGADNDDDGLVDEGNVCACSSYTWNGQVYELCNTGVPWSHAREACRAMGKDLVKVANAAENSWLGSLPMGQGRWLGLTDAVVEGTWRWIDSSTPAAFAGWSKYEPNGGTRENCGQMWQGGAWNDLDCTWNAIFMCEQEPEIDVIAAWVTRLPRIDYVWGSSNPGVEGWPAAGQSITWQGHVRNKSALPLWAVPYRWLQDGAVIAEGTVNIPAGGTATVSLPWTWTFDRHRIELVVDSLDRFYEVEEQNNQIRFDSNAITVGLYVEQSVYDYFDQHQRELGVGASSWEDWAQRQVRMWNDMFAGSVYPETPGGVIDRIRLDKIVVVPDAALPLAGGLPTNNPNLGDRSVDLQWGFPATLLTGGFYSDTTTVSVQNPFYYEASLLHELGHARYLVDVYGFNVHDNGSGSTVAIIEGGLPVVGSPRMPLLPPWYDTVYSAKYTGLMNGNWPKVDRHSAVALNLIAGHRATEGNYNAPGNIGEYLSDLPAQNQLTIRDQNGQLLAGASVFVYRAGSKSGEWYGKYYDNTPDLMLVADTYGRVLLGSCPFDASCTIRHGYGHSNGVLIVRVESGMRVGYGFLEITDFNLEYWRGRTSLGRYDLRVNML